MKQFSIKRFANVARWDLSVNSKFYTRSAIMMMAFISTPIVLFYLYNMLTKGWATPRTTWRVSPWLSV